MAEVIPGGKVIQKPDVVLEVDDFLPPGVIGVRNKTREEAGVITGSASDSATGTVVEEDADNPNLPKNPPVYDGRLPIPTDMKIISQTTRIGADRKVTVDVVIETSDFPGVTEFEARVVRDS